MKRLLLLAACLLASGAAPANDVAEQVVKRLAEHSVVRARFEQLRQSASLPKPLVSRGRLAVSRKDGILWQIEQPVRVSLAFGPQGIVETAPDGSRRLVSQRRGAVQAEVARVMRSILSADIAQLRNGFEVEVRGSADKWTLRLAPKTREMARFMESIELSGGTFLEGIEIAETSGDRTSIRMRDFTTAGALEPAELAQFSPP